MMFQNQPQVKCIIPCLNKETISKINVYGAKGIANKHRDGSTKSAFDTIPTSFMTAGNY